MPGPPPTPNVIRMLRGHPSKRPMRREIELPREPEPPAWMPDGALAQMAPRDPATGALVIKSRDGAKTNPLTRISARHATWSKFAGESREVCLRARGRP